MPKASGPKLPQGSDLGLAVDLQRRLIGMIQTRLGTLARIHPSTLSAWANEKQQPSLVLLSRAAAVLSSVEAIKETADYLGDLRMRLRRWHDAGRQLPLVLEETSGFERLSDDDLLREMGRAHERLRTLERELDSRRRPAGR
jgi:transcriptional regulator with XRE-family HTH domain